ncbi:hypothetical protein D3C81_389410 [compost metagenome]
MACHQGGHALADADVRVQLVHGVGARLVEQAFDQWRRQVGVDVQGVQRLRQQLLAQGDRFGQVDRAQMVADGRTGLAGAHERQPRRAGARRGIGDDFHDIAIVQLGAQGRGFIVDLDGHGLVADARVNRIGEVDGRGAARQGDDLRLRRKYVDGIGEQVDLDVFEEFGRVARLLLDVEQGLQPRMGALLQVGRVRFAALVEPVRRYAGLGRAVHFLRADLEFHRRAVGADDGRVQRLVAVQLADRDVILELARHGLVQAVQGTQGHVAVGKTVHHHAEAVHVQHLRERQMLAAHLFIDVVQGLFAARHFCVELGHGKGAFHRFHDLVDHFAPVAARRLDGFRQGAVAHRVQVRERQVLQLVINVVQAEAVRDWHIHFHGLAGDAALFRRRHEVQGAHIVQAVGQLDQDHAHVGGHGQQHLAEVFRLRFDLALELDLFQLRQAIDQVRHRRAEALDQFILLDVLVFHDVVQQGGHDGLRVELPVGADFRDGDRMRDIRLARTAHLAQVHFVGEAVGFLDFFQVGGGQVFGQLVGQVADGSHAQRGCWRCCGGIAAGRAGTGRGSALGFCRLARSQGRQCCGSRVGWGQTHKTSRCFTV